MTRQQRYTLALTPMLYALSLAMGGCLTAKREIVVVEPGVPIRVVQTVKVRAEVVATGQVVDDVDIGGWYMLPPAHFRQIIDDAKKGAAK